MNDNTEDELKVMKTWDEALEKEEWIPPSVDIYESDDEYILEAEMPGVEKENLRIKYDEGFLVIMGRIDFSNVRNRKFILSESEKGNFYRKFKIADSIDEMKINARLENGVLQIALPKHEKIKPRIIDIK
jgi:HSP20 family protein